MVDSLTHSLHSLTHSLTHVASLTMDVVYYYRYGSSSSYYYSGTTVINTDVSVVCPGFEDKIRSDKVLRCWYADDCQMTLTANSTGIVMNVYVDRNEDYCQQQSTSYGVTCDTQDAAATRFNASSLWAMGYGAHAANNDDDSSTSDYFTTGFLDFCDYYVNGVSQPWKD